MKNYYTITWTEQKKFEAIKLLTEYFELFGTAETQAQCDDAQEEALDVLMVIADQVLIENEGIKFIEN